MMALWKGQWTAAMDGLLDVSERLTLPASPEFGEVAAAGRRRGFSEAASLRTDEFAHSII